MSIDLPAGLERDLEQYAEAEHMSVAEAAVKFIQSGLKSTKKNTVRRPITETEWEQLRQDPTVAFFERLPDRVFDQMEAARKQIRAERFTPRG